MHWFAKHFRSLSCLLSVELKARGVLRAEKRAWMSPVAEYVLTSVAVLAEISLRSPRKLFFVIIKNNNYRVKVSQNMYNLIKKKLHWCS